MKKRRHSDKIEKDCIGGCMLSFMTSFSAEANQIMHFDTSEDHKRERQRLAAEKLPASSATFAHGTMHDHRNSDEEFGGEAALPFQFLFFCYSV